MEQDPWNIREGWTYWLLETQKMKAKIHDPRDKVHDLQIEADRPTPASQLLSQAHCSGRKALFYHHLTDPV
jgi:hypothetical protein